MRGVPSKTIRFLLLTTCLILFLQPTSMAIEITGSYFEPITEDSVQWTLMFMGQPVGPDHIYGNFTLKLTFNEPPAQVRFWISTVIPENESHPTGWYEVLNTTSAPYECNISTLDYEIGKHLIRRMVRETNTSAFVGGDRTYFFEHQDKSIEQFLYTGATIVVYTVSMIGVVTLGYMSYKLIKKRSKTRISRFE